MSGKRIVAIDTLCQHGLLQPHDIQTPPDRLHISNLVCPLAGFSNKCPHPGHCDGGSRRTLIEGQYVLIEKVDGEWPEWADQAVVNAMSTWTHVGKETSLYKQLLPRARRFLDALVDAKREEEE